MEYFLKPFNLFFMTHGKRIDQLAQLNPAEINGRIKGISSRPGESAETLRETIEKIEAVRVAVGQITNINDWAPVFQQAYALPKQHAGWDKYSFERFLRNAYSRKEDLAKIDKSISNTVAEMRKRAEKWEANGGYEKVYKKHNNRGPRISRGVAKHNRMLKAALPRAEQRIRSDEHSRKMGQENLLVKREGKMESLVKELRDQKGEGVNGGQVMALTSTGHKIIFIRGNWKGPGFRVSVEGQKQHSRKMDRIYPTYEIAANVIIKEMGERWKMEPQEIEALKF